MFDFGAWELTLIAVVAIFVIGPKELPATLRAFGAVMRKLHNISVVFRAHVDDMVREAELDDLKKTANDLRQGDYSKIIEDTIDPDGAIRDALDDLDDADNEDDSDDLGDVVDMHRPVIPDDPNSRAEALNMMKDADKPLRSHRDEP